MVEGKTTNVLDLEFKKNVAAWRCFTLKAGTIKEIKGVEDTLKIPGVFKVCLDELYEGKMVTDIKDDKGKYGPILVEAASKEECKRIIKQAEKTLHVLTENNHEVSEMIW